MPCTRATRRAPICSVLCYNASIGQGLQGFPVPQAERRQEVSNHDHKSRSRTWIRETSPWPSYWVASPGMC